jgi:hypothetical protein
MTLSQRGRRTLEERLAMRFPRLRQMAVRAVWSLPARSRFRRAFLHRSVRLCIEAANRGDHEVAFAPFAADSESIFPPELAVLGEHGPRGRDARVTWERMWRKEWGEFSYLPEEFVDLGNRILLLGRMSGSGAGSGAAVDTDWAMIITPVAGEVVREQVLFDQAAALKAAGLT